MCWSHIPTYGMETRFHPFLPNAFGMRLKFVWVKSDNRGRSPSACDCLRNAMFRNLDPCKAFRSPPILAPKWRSATDIATAGEVIFVNFCTNFHIFEHGSTTRS